MKQRYTIIYRCRADFDPELILTAMDRVEVEDIAQTIRGDKYKGLAYFVFEGWPEIVNV